MFSKKLNPGSVGLNPKVQINKTFLHKNVNIYLPTIINIIYVLGAQKNRFIEEILLSTHNICFG